MIALNSLRKMYTSSLVPIEHGFGTKKFGDGRNHKQLITQTHSTHVHIWTSSDSSSIENCDGIITQLSKVTLSVVTADCVPIIFYDPVQKVIGISHQGWKGTLHKLPQKMIQKMKELGSSISNIRVAIGPAINQCCYEVNADLADQFNSAFGKGTSSQQKDKLYLNLLRINYNQLRLTGVKSGHIDYFPFCTSCNKNKFWSYRRDHGIKGEMESFIKLQ